MNGEENFESYPIPAPSGGLNLVDDIANMAANDAIELINLYPNGSKVEVRGGYQQHCDTASDEPIRSLYDLPLADGTAKLIACTDHTFQDVTTVTAADITGTTTPTSDDWNSTVFAHRRFFCNGVNTLQVYTGSGDVVDGTFTGVTQADLINVSSYKERLYFVEKSSASFWYGGTKAVAGALTEYDLSYFFKRGGRLLFAGSYTDRLSSVTQDLFFACSSEGEILYFAGDYPGNTWALAARHVIGKPLGYRAFIRVDNDVWILTNQGIVPISLLFSGGTTVALNAVGRKVNKFISTYAKQVGVSHLWHGFHWQEGRRVFITVPFSETDTILLVCNTDTGAWSKYDHTEQGAALAISNFDGDFFMGSLAGVVHQGESGDDDNGDWISFDGRLAFNYFGAPRNFKVFKDVRPLIRTRTNVALSLTIDTDYQQTNNIATLTTGGGSSTPWGSAWGSPWSPAAQYFFKRYGLKGQGHTGSIRIQGRIKNAPLELSALDVRYEVGGQV